MDERLTEIERQKQAALNQSNNTYGNMLQNNENLYNQQNSYAEQYENSQNEALNRQLQFQEDLINQQKDVARQNMEIESKKAKNDYVNYTNPYGLQAESFASQGLLNSGVSETAKLGGYNTYQNRLATANKVMQDAFLQYDNEINEARMNNDLQKAQNAQKKLEMQLQFASEYYSNKNSITQNQLTNNQNIDSEYYGRYSDEYNRIQEEKAREEAIRQWEAQMAEQQRQFNEQMAYQKEQDALAQQNWLKEYNLAKSSSSKSSKSSTSSQNINLQDGNIVSDTNIHTNYYNGAINPDTRYGTFGTKDKNGVEYQPDNVGGSKLKSSGKTVKDYFGAGVITGATGANIDNQRVWTTNGRLYVWDGSQNLYVDITDEIPSTKAGGAGGGRGF